jgi:predicted Na+-dependent transporter
MTATEFFGTIATLLSKQFIITSMLALGLSLTLSQIIEPLRNGRLVAQECPLNTPRNAQRRSDNLPR